MSAARRLRGGPVLVIAGDFPDADAARDRYLEYFTRRLAASSNFVNEALSARELRLSEPLHRRKARR